MKLDFRTLSDEASYILELHQDKSGIRFIRIRECTQPQDSPSVAFESFPVKGKQLRNWNMNGSDDVVQLTDGTVFILDAHQIWITRTEFEYLSFPSSMKAGIEPPWVGGIAPKFPPK